jgi:hypothetical protein
MLDDGYWVDMPTVAVPPLDEPESPSSVPSVIISTGTESTAYRQSSG